MDSLKVSICLISCIIKEKGKRKNSFRPISFHFCSFLGMLGVLIYNMNGSLHGSDDKAIPFRVFGDQGNQWVDKAVTLTTQEQFRVCTHYGQL